VAEALIALGANMGDARATLDRAVAMFCDGDAVTLRARSADYRTPPWGVERQPPFINLCLVVATALSPRDLLGRAQRVEQALGRNRAEEQHWGPRPVDIDLLAYDDVALREPDLVLPHPRLFERGFVLVPLAEIAADRLIAGIRVRDALARLDTAGIERLPARKIQPLSG
jgi:2-amino-4-hydroxy-6-hydroxymethyldihydropteridine diphosphokinase